MATPTEGCASMYNMYTHGHVRRTRVRAGPFQWEYWSSHRASVLSLIRAKLIQLTPIDAWERVGKAAQNPFFPPSDSELVFEPSKVSCSRWSVPPHNAGRLFDDEVCTIWTIRPWGLRSLPRHYDMVTFLRTLSTAFVEMPLRKSLEPFITRGRL